MIRTPTATIGIRGTIFTDVVLPDGTTAVTLEMPSSYVPVENLLGQIIKLITPGTGTVVTPNGNMTPPAVPPVWVLALIETLNTLLGFQQAKDEVIYNSAENPCDTSASPNCHN